MSKVEKVLHDDKFIMICNYLYGVLKERKRELQELSDETYNVSFNDAIDFSIASTAISIIKSFFYDTLHSYTTILLCRNIMEYFALKEMSLKGDISKESASLIKYNGFIEDYKQYYKKLNDAKYNKIINFKKLEEDFKGSVSEYNKYGITEKNILKMSIPFLLDKKASYEDLIKKYLPSFFDYYSYLSFLVHPHNYGMEIGLNNLDDIFVRIVDQLSTYYKGLFLNVTQNKSFAADKFFIDKYSKDDYPKKFFKLCADEGVELEIIRKAIEKKYGKNNYMNHFLCVIQEIILDIATDSLHYMPDACKMKYKTILEIFAIYNWLFLDCMFDEDRFRMLNYYSYIKEDELFKLDVEKHYQKAFELFIKIYPQSSDFNRFKNVFGSTLGFTVDDKYEKLKIGNLISKYIEKNAKGLLGEQYDNPEVVFNILYCEACSLSHGKAYSFFSNEGAMNEDFNVISLTDTMLYLFLKKYNLVIRCLDDKQEYKDIEDLTDEVLNHINEIRLNKLKLMLKYNPKFAETIYKS